jgi:DNA-binding NarL/FixJ family response regulator
VGWRGGRRDLLETIDSLQEVARSPGCPDDGAPGTRLRSVSDAAPATVLVYSHRPEVRAAVRTAVGRKPAPDVGPLTWLECETGDDVIATVDNGGVDLCILDGEAQPTGGLALARQLDEEVADRPLVCVLIARQQDRWLAHWSRADATLPFPVDPLTVPAVVAELLRDRAGRRPVVRR